MSSQIQLSHEKDLQKGEDDKGKEYIMQSCAVSS